ncbi:hypothetical protein BQ8794_230081 [Mesorhizobium prunaredense]|uniref:Uncharacterized protein n=1 Tax=Mesorhizobium prunaredense TaxID=1631249 RepID=A0A1R3V7G4_9HYPH|nr:hypothetical protein BQ8794_230081 [Mesorhizobium prunaredense]
MCQIPAFVHGLRLVTEDNALDYLRRLKETRSILRIPVARTIASTNDTNGNRLRAMDAVRLKTRSSRKAIRAWATL